MHEGEESDNAENGGDAGRDGSFPDDYCKLGEDLCAGVVDVNRCVRVGAMRMGTHFSEPLCDHL